MTKETVKANGHISDPMALTWSEKYDKTITRFWNKLPGFLRGTLATVAIFLMGLSVNGMYLCIWRFYIYLEILN